MTSSHVLITGAAPDCQNDSQLRLFVICIVISLVIVFMFSYGYHKQVDVACTMSLPSWCAHYVSDHKTLPSGDKASPSGDKASHDNKTSPS